MKTFREMIQDTRYTGHTKYTGYAINESKEIIYHGDNFGTKKLDPKLMNNGNNQEGVGIYFGDLETAQSYGRHVISIEINPKNFIDSRKPIGKYVSTSKIAKILNDMWKVDEEEMYYMITDWGIEIPNPEDIEKRHITFLASKMSNDEVRNFQVTLADTFNVVDFVKSWNKILPNIHGTYQKQNRDTWYAVINTDYKVTTYKN